MLQCAVCGEQEGRYRCPRCEAPYCSVGCFRQHGDASACAEAFYKAQIEEEQALRRVEALAESPADRSKRESAADDAKRGVAGMLLRTLEADADAEAEAKLEVDADARAYAMAGMPLAGLEGTGAETAAGAKTGAGSGAFELDEQDAGFMKRLQQACGEAVSDDALDGLSAAQLEAVLSDDQLARFKRMAAAGQLNRHVAPCPYRPFWELPPRDYEAARKRKTRRRLVQDVGDPGTRDLDLDLDLDEPRVGAAASGPGSGNGPEGLPAPAVWFSRADGDKAGVALFAEFHGCTLASIKAPTQLPPTLRFHVASVLLAYVHTLRHFNGDVRSDADVRASALALAMQHSSILRGERFAPESLEQVLLDFAERAPVVAQRDGENRAARGSPEAQAPATASPWLVREVGEAAAAASAEASGLGLGLAVASASLEQHFLDLGALYKQPGVLVVDALLDVWFLVGEQAKARKKSKVLMQVQRKLWFMAVWANTADPHTVSALIATK